MMTRYFIILFFGLSIGCQPEPETIPYRLEMRLLQLELAVLNEDVEMVRLLADEVSEIYKEVYPESENEIDVVKRMVNAIKENHTFQAEYTHLIGLKELIINLPENPSFRDGHLDALLVYGNKLLPVLKVSTDVMMDLYEWNEFYELSKNLKEAWIVLDGEPVSQELLRYNTLKATYQARAIDELRIAMNDFMASMERKDDTLYDICSNAETVRDRYVDYLEVLSSIQPDFQGDMLE